MIKKSLKVIEGWIPRIALVLVVLEPLLSWLADAVQAEEFVFANPYTSWDINLALIFGILNILYTQMVSEKTGVGDESNILLNRNQSDYYEVWAACKKRSF